MTDEFPFIASGWICPNCLLPPDTVWEETDMGVEAYPDSNHDCTTVAKFFELIEEV